MSDCLHHCQSSLLRGADWSCFRALRRVVWAVLLISSGFGSAVGQTEQAPQDDSLQLTEQTEPAIGVRGRVGCLDDNPTVVERLEITEPGIYENYLVDSQWKTGNRVKVTADNVIIRNCEIRHASGNGIGVFGTNVLIENCKIHHLLLGTFEAQKDVHGITGQWGNITIRNCEIGFVSGDAIQFDPDRRSTGTVIVENCTLCTGPLSEDMAGFRKGERPGENAIDTKTPSPEREPERCQLIVRDTLMFGWNQPGQIDLMAALNLKENIRATVVNCVFVDNEIALRVRGPTYRGSAIVTVRDCAIYNTSVGIRAENLVEDLTLINVGTARQVRERFQRAGAGRRQPLPGFLDSGRFAPPPFAQVIQEGVAGRN